MKDYLVKIITQAIKHINYPEVAIQIEKPKLQQYGDFSTNVALILSKSLKQAPKKIAEEIIKNLEYDSEYIEKIEIAGGGFINFFATDKFFLRSINEILEKKSEFGKSNLYKGKTANIEWVSANPTKPLHAGHGRQICLGKAIANMLEWIGYKVIREYYYNDAGMQMTLLGKSVQARYEQIFNKEYPFPEDGYQGNYIGDIAQEIFNKYGDKYRNSNDIEFFKREGEKYNFNSIRKTLERLGIKHDVFFNESDLYKDGSIINIIEEFKKRNLVYEKDGALWLKLSEKLKQDKVIMKSTGEYTYRLPDMAYHINKLERKYDLIIDIFGADHSDTYKEVLSGIELLGYDTSKIKVIIHQMVTFRSGGKSLKMSGRYGTFYSLDDLINDIGIDATQFFFIMRSANSHLDFDIELAKEQSDKNPVYYLQYAHARICGILRHSIEIINDFDQINLSDVDFNLLKNSDEINLIKELVKFPDEVISASIEYEPHRIIGYLNSVAECFHRFYRNNRVLNPNDITLSLARLNLCLATKQVLKNGFDIIGITAPERMERDIQ
ncbi:MAG: arginine--tRNA ligase [Ignavibacteria bacterium]|nr:arginine--tRNA ligase [Ignavibacteria bacterium]